MFLKSSSCVITVSKVKKVDVIAVFVPRLRGCEEKACICNKRIIFGAMIRLIEAKNFRSLRYISQPMGDFHVLVGANATGKSTFLDVVKFISDIVSVGIDKAISDRVSHFDELTFSGNGNDIELALEVQLPDSIAAKFNGKQYNSIRYELRIGKLEDTNENAIKDERATLFNSELKTIAEKPRTLFPQYVDEDAKICGEKIKSQKTILSKRLGGNDTFTIEPTKEQEGKGRGWIPTFKLGVKKSALGNLPEDITKFPSSSWLKSFLKEGVQLFVLNSSSQISAIISHPYNLLNIVFIICSSTFSSTEASLASSLLKTSLAFWRPYNLKNFSISILL